MQDIHFFVVFQATTVLLGGAGLKSKFKVSKYNWSRKCPGF